MQRVAYRVDAKRMNNGIQKYTTPQCVANKYLFDKQVVGDISEHNFWNYS